MKHIKYFETISVELKRGDIILRELDRYSRGQYEYDFFVVLNDVMRKNRIINVYHIGEISFFAWDDINYSINHRDIYKIYKSDDVTVISKDEQELLYEEMYNGNFQNIINLVKDKTDIDLRDSDSYNYFLIKKTSEKYNL